ncbi:MAG: hypothetical protein RLZZ356_1793, partial [Verrucomicrobiota bacterium]
MLAVSALVADLLKQVADGLVFSNRQCGVNTNPPMTTWIKGLAALVLFLLASLCLQRFRADFSSVEMKRAGLESSEPATESVAETPANPSPSASGTNTLTTSNAVSPASIDGTNAVASTSDSKGSPAPAKAPDKSRSFLWMGGFVASLLGLAGLVGWEVARWFSRRTGDVLLSENAPATTDAEYEAAEAEWANGNPMEAIRMMREYLDKNPSEQYAAIRIAEIYEKDLHNFVAASLELEEVLTKRLSREKWGWTAIHLANLYSGK